MVRRLVADIGAVYPATVAPRRRLKALCLHQVRRRGQQVASSQGLEARVGRLKILGPRQRGAVTGRNRTSVPVPPHARMTHVPLVFRFAANRHAAFEPATTSNRVSLLGTSAPLTQETTIRSIYLDRCKRAKLLGEVWTVDTYRNAVDRSSLKAPVRRTLHAMVDSTSGRHTTIDRASLCLLTGVAWEGTITEHWQRARDAGLLTSAARYNRSSLHTFTIPGRELPDLDPDASLFWPHVWTEAEIAWWDVLDSGTWAVPPWRDGRPPF